MVKILFNQIRVLEQFLTRDFGLLNKPGENITR